MKIYPESLLNLKGFKSSHRFPVDPSLIRSVYKIGHIWMSFFAKYIISSCLFQMLSRNVGFRKANKVGKKSISDTQTKLCWTVGSTSQGTYHPRWNGPSMDLEHPNQDAVHSTQVCQDPTDSGSHSSQYRTMGDVITFHSPGQSRLRGDQIHRHILRCTTTPGRPRESTSWKGFMKLDQVVSP